MKILISRIIYFIFWFLFFGFFFYKLIPKLQDYVIWGLPDFMGESLFSKRLWFALHIFFGIVVYITGLIQFTPYIRNKNIGLHRKVGKIYIVSSLLCILSLYFILPEGTCSICRISQYIVTNLWLIFLLLAYYFIRQRKIISHQRMMIRSYICAIYFVTIRVIDKFAMGIFIFFFKNEDDQMLASDFSVWLLPLIGFELYWLISSKNKQLT